MYNLSDITIGMELPEFKKPVDQEHINLYARASGDFNPIHVDPEFAKKMQLSGTIAHGMMILAYLSEYMTMNFGVNWFTSGKLCARFKEPVHPSTTVIISGKIVSIEKDEDQTLISCNIICQNQKGHTIINGETKVRLTV